MTISFKKIATCLFWIVWTMLFLFSVTVIVVNIFTKPSNDRDWRIDQKVLPYGEIENKEGEELITIHNIRNFTYASTTSYTPGYYDKTFNLNEIKKVWYVVSPFSGIPGSAHTFLSFEFENDQFISISVEVRKEKDELFQPIKGIFNNFEITYIISDERDVLKLRSNYQKDLTYVYPIRTEKETARALFLDMVERANTLKAKPEFYNTLTNNCTINIARHVNHLVDDRVPLDITLLLPANSDRLAYELGLIDTDLPFEQAREKYLVNERAEKYADDPAFSRKIRE